MRTIAIVIGMIALVGFGFAQTAPASAPTSAPTIVLGTVEAIDAAKNEITVKDIMGKVEVVAVTAETKITKEGKDIVIADVKVGDKVTIRKDAGKVTHIVVAVQAAAPVAPAAPPVAPAAK